MARCAAMLLGLALMALAVVHLRAEQARLIARALAHESRWIELRREKWDVEVQMARLRSPERVRHWLETFGGDVAHPPESATGAEGDEQGVDGATASLGGRGGTSIPASSRSRVVAPVHRQSPARATH